MQDIQQQRRQRRLQQQQLQQQQLQHRPGRRERHGDTAFVIGILIASATLTWLLLPG